MTVVRACPVTRVAATRPGIFGFTGEQHDPATGLLYLRARYYQPGLGRFLSADAVQPNAPGTQGYNLYAYVANNPTTWVDPTGHLASYAEFLYIKSMAGGSRGPRGVPAGLGRRPLALQPNPLVAKDGRDLQFTAERLHILPQRREVDVLFMLDPGNVRLADVEPSGEFGLRYPVLPS
jgi:RHS repeat-associated protein